MKQRKRRKNQKNSRRANGILMQGAYAAGYEAFWGTVYEEVTRMAEDPEVRRDFNRAAIRVFKAIIEKLKAEVRSGKPHPKAL